MPLFYVRTCNSDLETIDDGNSYVDAKDALAAGIDAAMNVAADEIRQGQPNSAVDVRVEDAGGKEQLRSVVALSVSPLLVESGFALSAKGAGYADND